MRTLPQASSQHWCKLTLTLGVNGLSWPSFTTPTHSLIRHLITHTWYSNTFTDQFSFPKTSLTFWINWQILGRLGEILCWYLLCTCADLIWWALYSFPDVRRFLQKSVWHWTKSVKPSEYQVWCSCLTILFITYASTRAIGNFSSQRWMNFSLIIMSNKTTMLSGSLFCYFIAKHCSPFFLTQEALLFLHNSLHW